MSLHLLVLQNLPDLSYLDMAYNSLTVFDFDYFDQVCHINIVFTPTGGHL